VVIAAREYTGYLFLAFEGGQIEIIKMSRAVQSAMR